MWFSNLVASIDLSVVLFALILSTIDFCSADKTGVWAPATGFPPEGLLANGTAPGLATVAGDLAGATTGLVVAVGAVAAAGFAGVVESTGVVAGFAAVGVGADL